MILSLPHRSLSSKLFAEHRWFLLALIGFLSWTVYQLGWLQHYSFSALGLVPLLDISKLTHADPIGQAGNVLTMVLSFGLYYLAYRVCRSQRSRWMWVALSASLLAINLAMMWLYPIGAADVFDSLMHGRMTSHYQADPFYTAPKQFPDDPLAPYTGWSNTTATYGPLFEWFTAGVTGLAGDNVLNSVLLFKAMLLIFYTGTALIVGLLVKRRDPDRALQAVCFFAWNPLVIYSTIGNGHNDIMMVFFIAVGALLLDSDRYTLAALAFTAGGAIKFISIALIPIALVMRLRQDRSWRATLKFVIITGLVCAGFFVLTSVPFYRGGDFLGFEWKFGLYTSSIPSVVQAALQGTIGLDASRTWVNRAALFLLALTIVYQIWRVARSKDWRAPLRACLIILLVYLLVSVAWFQAWYIQWALVVAAMLLGGTGSRLTMLLSYSVMWKSIFIDYYLYNGYWIEARDQRELLIVLATFGIVWLYAGLLFVRTLVDKSRMLLKVQPT